jgi:hypothetical protein
LAVDITINLGSLDAPVSGVAAFHKVQVNPSGLTVTARQTGAVEKSAIYVLLALDTLTPIANTSELVSESEALRPHRQVCGLLGGASNLYRNAPALRMAWNAYLMP